MPLQKDVKSRVFWIFKKRKNVFSNYGSNSENTIKVASP